MNDDVKPRRRYRSPTRAEQARRTQARILEAARALFLKRGFAGATIAAVAHEAGVSPETVYATYRTKAGLLEGVMMGAANRDADADEILERRWFVELLELPDLAARLAALARHTAQTVELTSPMHAIIAEAGELGALRRQLQEFRFSNQRQAVAAIAKGRALRPGLTVQEAADTFSALASPELHRVLTVDRGWSQRRYARWLERTAVALLAG